MAKAILTFEDRDDGTTNVKIEFDPPVVAKEPPTAAQYHALKCLEAIRRDDEESGDDE